MPSNKLVDLGEIEMAREVQEIIPWVEFALCNLGIRPVMTMTLEC